MKRTLAGLALGIGLIAPPVAATLSLAPTPPVPVKRRSPDMVAARAGIVVPFVTRVRPVEPATEARVLRRHVERDRERAAEAAERAAQAERDHRAWHRQQEAARAAAAAPAVPTGSVWDRLAQCESNGRWNLNVGLYDGGLQFHPKTWIAAGGRKYSEYAWQATREQQIAIAESWLSKTSWAQWPACSLKLGLR